MKNLLLSVLMLMATMNVGWGQCGGPVGIINLNDSILFATHTYFGGQYSYLWSNGETSSVIEIPSTPGIYCLTITDSEACEQAICIDIPTTSCGVVISNHPTALHAIASGVAPIQYAWAYEGDPIIQGYQSDTLYYRGGGQYCVTITDGNGCTSTDCTTMAKISCELEIQRPNDTTFVALLGGEPYDAYWVSENFTISSQSTIDLGPDEINNCAICIFSNPFVGCPVQSVCYGGPINVQIAFADDTLSAFPSGIPPYTYIWDDGETNKVRPITSATNYCVTITDATGLTATDCKDLNACYSGSISFYTQEEVNTFVTNHPDCDRIGGNLSLLYESFDLSGLSSITEIGGDLKIISSNNVTGLSSLTTVKGDVYINDYLHKDLNLSGLESLTTIKGKLTLRNCGILADINNLSNLTSIGGLELINNESLADISALSNITSLSRSLKIKNCPALTNLIGLHNITSISCSISITGNTNLTTCTICNALNGFSGHLTLANNATGCNSVQELSCGNIISGTVFVDLNQNQIQDPNEPGLAGQRIWFDNPGQFIFSDSDGFYFQVATDGSYNVNWVNDPDWQATTPSSYSLDFVQGDPNNLNHDFGLYPTNPTHKLGLHNNFPRARCNTTINFNATVINEGFFTENGRIEVNYNTNIDFIISSITPDVIDETNGFLAWNFSDLMPFDIKNFHIIFKMPSEQAPAEYMYITTSVFREEAGADILDAETVHQSLILCSYDPNDKLVYPPGISDEHLTQKDRNLSYTIRFQNTGNTYAKDVVLRDTLDPNLDWATFKVRNSSHKVHTSLSTEGLATFNFKNIYLVDSTDNLESSQGFVTYTISPKGDLPENTVINNTAHIYFDFNAAVVTNTTKNTLVTQLPVAIQDVTAPITFTLFPNPTSDKFHILLHDNNGAGILEIVTTDLAGKILQHQTTHNQRVISIDANYLPQGMYFISLKDKNTGAILYTEKLVIK